MTVEQRFTDVQERPDRPVGHGKADAPRPSITCLQSQIGGGRHLRSWGAAQVEGAVALSVVVRLGPIMAAGCAGQRACQPSWGVRGPGAR